MIQTIRTYTGGAVTADDFYLAAETYRAAGVAA
jgi:hypothetical protein